MNAQSVLPMLCVGGTAASMLACAVVPPIVIVTVQILALKHVGKDFPLSMWTFEMNPGYHHACHQIFKVMNWTVIMCFVGLFISIIHFCVSACTFQQEGSETKQGCSFCTLNLVRLAQSIVAIWGAVVTGRAKNDCSECAHLYNVAWWCYLGIPLIALVLGCCLVPLMWCGVLFSGAPTSRPEPRLQDLDALLSAPMSEAHQAHLRNMHSGPGVLQADLQRFQRAQLVQPHRLL